MGFSKEFDEWQLIVCPVLSQFMCGRKFAARDLKRDFIASKPDVVVILHAAGQRIPSSTVGNSIVERRCTDIVPARDTSRHFCMVVGVYERNVLENVIIWRQRRSWRKRLEHWTQGTYWAKVDKRKKIPFITSAYEKQLCAFDFQGLGCISSAIIILTGARRRRSTNLLWLSVLRDKKEILFREKFFNDLCISGTKKLVFSKKN